MNAVATAVILPAAAFVALACWAQLMSLVSRPVSRPVSVPTASRAPRVLVPSHAAMVGSTATSAPAAPGPAAPGRAAYGLPLEADEPHERGTRTDTPWARYGRVFALLAWGLLTVSLVARTVATGHAPYSNQYEFAVSFAWGVLSAYLVLDHRFGARTLALAALPVALGLLLYARTIASDPRPLQPALQQQWLLAVHVAAAVVAYGAAAVAFAAAVLYLVRSRWAWAQRLPSAQRLDELGYRAVLLAFPVMTLMIILGAVWAQRAWGHYWSWDPKETAALVTWLIYAAYLHARLVRDWRGRKAAGLLILGFAAVVFTYAGNLFLGGLHAYA